MEQIKTKLKFIRSGKNNTFVGFVTKDRETGAIRGVHECDDVPKKICIVPLDMSYFIVEGVLYNVLLQRTPEGNGYVVDSAEPVAFKATVESCVIRRVVYRVEVSFGNKTIAFDPLEGKKYSMRTIEGALEVLRSRKDIKNYLDVEEEFLKAANAVLCEFEADGYYVSKTKDKITQKKKERVY